MVSSKKASHWAQLVDVDRLIHEPARLVICAVLTVAEEADFLYLRRETNLTKGNLSSHLSRLEEGGYIEIIKSFDGKTPRTTCRMTEAGRVAFDQYVAQMQDALGKLPE